MGDECQTCGAVGGKGMTFELESITTSMWICPFCVGRFRGALDKIASLDDVAANARLAETGSYALLTNRIA